MRTMMNKFNNLRMKYKLLVLPAFAILGLTIVMISASYFNSRADHELQLVRRGYYPSVQLSRDVQNAVVALQRSLQDGVAASDAAAIAETANVHQQVLARIDAGKTNPVIAQSDLQSLRSAIDGYYQLASQTSLRMVKGETGEVAYVVKSGRVEIREGGRVLEALGPGGLFGEMAMIDSSPRSASAVAVGPTDLVVIDRETFDALIREVPDFAISVMRLMAKRLRTTTAALPAPEERRLAV